MKARTPYLFIYTLYFLFTCSACHDRRDPEELRGRIEAMAENFHVAFEDRQIDTLMDIFHSNARLTISGKGVLKGKEQIRSYFQRHFQTTSYSTDLTEDTILMSDNIFIYQGRSIGQIEDFESGMTYPLFRFSTLTFTFDELDEIKLFDYTFVDKD